MIRIKCGTCGTSAGFKTKADGEFSLPAAEEARLVRRGVAEYATRAIIGPASGADSPVEGGDEDVAGIDPPDDTPPVEGLENGGDDTPAVNLPGSAETLDIVDRHFTRESLMLMRRPDMEKLAGDLGVDVSRCKNKSDIADLLVEVEIEVQDETGGEAPPELGAEAPVV